MQAWKYSLKQRQTRWAYSYTNQTDQTVQKALEVLEEGKSFPVAPEQPVTAKKEKHDQGKEKTTAQIDQPKEKAVSGPATYEVVFQLA